MRLLADRTRLEKFGGGKSPTLAERCVLAADKARARSGSGLVVTRVTTAVGMIASSSSSLSIVRLSGVDCGVAGAGLFAARREEPGDGR